MNSFIDYLNMATKTVIEGSVSVVYSLTKMIFNPNERDSNVSKKLYEKKVNTKDFEFNGINDYITKVRTAMFEIGVLPEGLEEKLE